MLFVGVVVLVAGSFFLIHLVGGDPVRTSLGIGAPPDLVQLRRHQLHLDQPLLTQLGYYVDDLVHLRFGTSILSGQPVSRTISQRLPNTLELAGIAIVFVFVFSVGLGIAVGAATRNRSHPVLEFSFGGATGTAIAVPEFLTATFLVFLFGVTWKVLPVAGKTGPSSFVLPAASLALAPTALLARIVRVETIRVLSREYMVTARSKHLPRRIFYLRHAMPNLLTSALTLGGVIFGTMIGGDVIVENVFAWPGVGTAVVSAILGRDYPTVQAITFILGISVLLVNTLVDVVISFIDPRSTLVEH